MGRGKARSYKGDGQLLHGGVVGEDIAGVDGEGVFLIATHSADVELGDADRAKGVELVAMGFDRADETETVNHFVGDKVGIVAPDLTVVLISVSAAIFDKGGQRGR